jgi:DNA invertase Pin-like site-specific DNA recombinase
MDDQDKIPCAAWYRVSSDHQESANQVPDVERLIRHRGYAVAGDCTYRVAESAYHVKDAGDYEAELNRMLADAHSGKFKVLVVWAVDRLCREGIEEVFRLVSRLRKSGVMLVSVQEPWLDGSNETTELMLAIHAWIANQESRRRSERIKAGLARRKAEGKAIGRAAGAKDKRKRRTRGYLGNQNASKAS